MLNKKIVSIPSFLLSEEESTKLGLQDQSYVLIIPKKLLDEDFTKQVLLSVSKY